MIEYPLILLGGLLGSSHCVGMCGGFAMLVGMNRPTFRENLKAQLSFSAGRLMTYCTLGATSGYIGLKLVKSAPQLLNVPAALCLLAGLLLIVEGLFATGFIKRRGLSMAPQSGCLMSPLFATVLKLPGLRNAFSAGLLTGMLPCGLLYAFLSLAASTGDLLRGMGVMVAFGLGTVPLMVATGAGAMLLKLGTRERLMKAAAWCVVLTGALTVWRGGAFLYAANTLPPDAATTACPFCVSHNPPPAAEAGDVQP